MAWVLVVRSHLSVQVIGKTSLMAGSSTVISLALATVTRKAHQEGTVWRQKDFLWAFCTQILLEISIEFHAVAVVERKSPVSWFGLSQQQRTTGRSLNSIVVGEIGKKRQNSWVEMVQFNRTANGKRKNSNTNKET